MREGTRGMRKSSEMPGISLRLLTVSNICTPATGTIKSITPATNASQDTAARNLISQSRSLHPPAPLLIPCRSCPHPQMLVQYKVSVQYIFIIFFKDFEGVGMMLPVWPRICSYTFARPLLYSVSTPFGAQSPDILANLCAFGACNGTPGEVRALCVPERDRWGGRYADW